MTSLVKQWKQTVPWQSYKKAKEYDEAAFRIQELQKRIKNQVEPFLITKFLKSGQKVLDIGCGTGRITMPIYKHGCVVSALDNSQGMLQVFKEKNPDADIEFKLGDVCSIPWEDNTFDACTAITVVRHFPEWQDVVREMRRVVKPGGRILFEVGSGECIREANKRGLQADHQINAKDPCSYDTFLTEDEIRATFKGLNIKVVDLLSYDLLNNNYFLKSLMTGYDGTNDRYDYWWGSLGSKLDDKTAEDLFVWLSKTIFTLLPKEWGYNIFVVGEVL